MRAVGEDEDGTATWILAKAAEDFGVESVEGFAHVAGFEGEEDPEAARECQHGRRRAARSSKASGKAAREAISRAAPQGSTMRNASGGSGVADKHLGECRPGAIQGGNFLAALAQPGDESLVLDAMLAGKGHGARAAAVKGLEQRLLLGG